LPLVYVGLRGEIAPIFTDFWRQLRTPGASHLGAIENPVDGDDVSHLDDAAFRRIELLDFYFVAVAADQAL
jgi:hypothetical protein